MEPRRKALFVAGSGWESVPSIRGSFFPRCSQCWKQTGGLDVARVGWGMLCPAGPTLGSHLSKEPLQGRCHVHRDGTTFSLRSCRIETLGIGMGSS